MNNFDYETQRAVGIMKINYSGHGYINVCGYLTVSQFFPLTEDEAKEMFPPRGKIFAHNVSQKYNDYDGECITISVIPNAKEGEGYDDYIWDKSTDIELEGCILKKIDDLLSDNGERNFKILSENNLLDQEETVYVLSGEYIYKIDTSDSRFIPFFNAGKAKLVYSEKRETYYLLDTDLGEPENVIDITNDNQLIDWFTNKILKPNWTVIQEGGTKEAQNIVRETLLSYKQLPLSIAENRYNRLSKLIGIYKLTKESIDNLQNFPWIIPTIESSINNLKEEYFKKIEEDNQEKISRVKQEYEEQIIKEKTYLDQRLCTLQQEFENQKSTYEIKHKDLVTHLTEKEDELKMIDVKIAETRKALISEEEKLLLLQSRKDDILKDFKVIKDVLNIQNQHSPENEFFLDYTENNAESPFIMFNTFQTILGCWMSTYGLENEKSNDIATLLSKYKVVLLPNNAIIKSIMMATGKCTYLTAYVNVAWKSYNDLWESGLHAIVDECRRKQDRLHFLILKNINLSYIPNYLQPILDLQSGFAHRLPNEKETFPANLRIMATASSDRVIPMTRNSLELIGCIGKIPKCNNSSEFKQEELKDKGFLTPQILNEISHEISVNNKFEEYLDEN